MTCVGCDDFSTAHCLSCDNFFCDHCIDVSHAGPKARTIHQTGTARDKPYQVDADYFARWASGLAFDLRDRLTAKNARIYLDDVYNKIWEHYRYGPKKNEAEKRATAPREYVMSVLFRFGSKKDDGGGGGGDAREHDDVDGGTLAKFFENGPNVAYVVEFSNMNMQGMIEDVFADSDRHWFSEAVFNNTELEDRDVDLVIKALVNQPNGFSAKRLSIIGRQYITDVGEEHMRRAILASSVASSVVGDEPTTFVYVPYGRASSGSSSTVVDDVVRPLAEKIESLALF
jgi:hypothetical protein